MGEQKTRWGSQQAHMSHPPGLHPGSDIHSSATAGTPLPTTGSEHPIPPPARKPVPFLFFLECSRHS